MVRAADHGIFAGVERIQLDRDIADESVRVVEVRGRDIEDDLAVLVREVDAAVLVELGRESRRRDGGGVDFRRRSEALEDIAFFERVALEVVTDVRAAVYARIGDAAFGMHGGHASIRAHGRFRRGRYRGRRRRAVRTEVQGISAVRHGDAVRIRERRGERHGERSRGVAQRRFGDIQRFAVVQRCVRGSRSGSVRNAAALLLAHDRAGRHARVRGHGIRGRGLVQAVVDVLPRAVLLVMHGAGVHDRHFGPVFQRILFRELLAQGGIFPEHSDLIRRHRVRHIHRLEAFVRIGGIPIRRQCRYRQKLEQENHRKKQAQGFFQTRHGLSPLIQK